jgi:ribosome biogenesis protein NSA2
MPQNEYIEQWQKQHGKRLDHEERSRKREAREKHTASKFAQKVTGIKAKLLHQRRYKEKAAMIKKIKMHEEKEVKTSSAPTAAGPIPAYLMDRNETNRAKVLSNTLKQKRKEKAGKWDVPVPKVKALADDEVFRVTRSGKRQKKQWKRTVTKVRHLSCSLPDEFLQVTFVGPSFTRKPPKYERFIRPSALRFTKANVTHPQLATTFQLNILGVKKNPSSSLYTSLGVITKGTVIEVNVSELGLVTPSGQVVFGKYAQVTNNPENDGCINAILLV